MVDAKPSEDDGSVSSRLSSIKELILSKDRGSLAYRRNTVQSIDFNSMYTAPDDITRAVSAIQYGAEKLLDELGIVLTDDDRDAEVNEILIDIVECIVQRKGAV